MSAAWRLTKRHALTAYALLAAVPPLATLWFVRRAVPRALAAPTST